MQHRMQHAASLKNEMTDNHGGLLPKYETALFYAALHGDVREVVRLLKQGADFKTPNRFGLTAMHAAFLGNSPPCVYHLLDAASNSRDDDDLPDPAAPIQGSSGFTLLHYLAGVAKSAEVVRYLLAEGASPFQTDKKGDTPMDIVARSRHCNPLLVLMFAKRAFAACLVFMQHDGEDGPWKRNFIVVSRRHPVDSNGWGEHPDTEKAVMWVFDDVATELVAILDLDQAYIEEDCCEDHLPAARLRLVRVDANPGGLFVPKENGNTTDDGLCQLRIKEGPMLSGSCKCGLGHLLEIGNRDCRVRWTL